MYVPSVLVRHAIAPAWAKWERSAYLRHYRNLRKTQFMKPDAHQARQLESLRRLLMHARDTVPFYRERFEAVRFKPERLTGFDSLKQIPVLTKAEIRSNGSDLMSAAYAHDGSLSCKRTSGSTGVSLRIWVDAAAQQFKRAITLRSDEWSGWRFGEPSAALWGNPEYLRHGWRGWIRNTLLERRLYLDTLKMDQAAMARFADQLRRTQPPLLFGHAHSVYVFAEFVGQYCPGLIRPRGIITSAMILYDRERQVIEDQFGCKVTNRYGCEELSMIACECEHHQGLHVITDNVHLEIERDGRSVLPGEFGSVIVTDLVNRAMPLIRYKVGDVACWSESVCPCGRDAMPRLAKVEGREADFVTTLDGGLISGISLTENFALLVPGIAQLQIIQEDLDLFRYRIVKGPDFSAVSELQIAQVTRERFGPGVRHECEFVKTIPQEPSGKYRFCISRVPNRFMHSSQTPLPSVEILPSPLGGSQA